MLGRKILFLIFKTFVKGIDINFKTFRGIMSRISKISQSLNQLPFFFCDFFFHFSYCLFDITKLVIFFLLCKFLGNFFQKKMRYPDEKKRGSLLTSALRHPRECLVSKDRTIPGNHIFSATSLIRSERSTRDFFNLIRSSSVNAGCVDNRHN